MILSKLFSHPQGSEHKEPRKTGKTERRSEYRERTYFDTTLIQNDQRSHATIINFSKSGLGILTEHPFAVNDPIKLSVNTGSEDLSITINADVKRCQRSGEDFLVGVQTESLHDHFGVFLRSVHRRAGIRS